MLEKLQKFEEEYVEIEGKLSDPAVIGNQKDYQILIRRHKQLSKIVELFRSLKTVQRDLQDAEEILQNENDEDLRELAKEQLKNSKDRQIQLEDAVKVELLPKDTDDFKNAIIEIRAGAGGEEAALFAGELSRMYIRFAEKIGFKVELMNKNEATAGGLKEIMFKVVGESA